MITEDQLEQLAIQWFQDTGWSYVHGAVIAPEGVAAEREDFRAVVLKWRLVEAAGRMCRPFRAWTPAGDLAQGVALGCGMMPRWGGRRVRSTIKSDLIVRSRGGGRAACKGLQDRLERNQNP